MYKNYPNCRNFHLTFRPVVTHVNRLKEKMVQLTSEQRVFVVTNFIRTQSVPEVQDAFRVAFPDRNPPLRNTILDNVRKYQNTGTSLNRNRGNSGRRRSERTEGNVAAVRELLEQNPRVSCRRNPTALSSATFNRITRLDLLWHPYRIHVRHELLETDCPRRLCFSQWFNQHCQNENFLNRFFIGDEAAFEMNGQVNTHNVREYAPKLNPPAFNFDRSKERSKLTVWAGVCGDGLILGPYFFERNVDGVAYLRMLNEFVFPQLANHFNNQYWEGMFRGLWWAQDGAPAHRLLAVRDRLNETFLNRVVGLGHNVEWPPRSPDLTPCDFFLWGYLKAKVFSTPPQNIQVLRQKIVDEFNDLRQSLK